MRVGIGMKLAVVAGLVVLLMIPLTMLRWLVAERQQRAWEVREQIAHSTSRAQSVSGPLLVLETQVERDDVRTIAEDGVVREVSQRRRELQSRLVLPATLEIGADLDTEVRGRSLFSALLIHSSLTVAAGFRLPALPDGEVPVRAWLVMGLGDSRGLRELTLSADGQALAAEPGTGIAWLGQGVRFALPLERLAHGTLSVHGELALSGTEALQFLPVGGETRVQARGAWPHPGFVGASLPQAPRVDAAGFAAQWHVNRLASGAQQAVLECGVASEQCPGAGEAAFGVRLIDPVDRYLMTERAIKYALVILVLVFGTVFFIEVLQRRALHPLQYGLVGLALAMFFLLLLSLSEHIGFGPAYGLAALACIALIAAYLAGVLDSRRHGALVCAALATLYGLLYGLLQSEDYALLMGSLALFAGLAALMLATRRLDWTRLGNNGDGGS
jgi:inner membrane protein